MKTIFSTILMIILILGLTTPLFAFGESREQVLHLKGEITDFTVIHITEDGVEVSSNVLGFDFTVEKEGTYRIDRKSTRLNSSHL